MRETEFSYVLGEIQESVLIINTTTAKVALEYANNKFLETFSSMIGKFDFDSNEESEEEPRTWYDCWIRVKPRSNLPSFSNFDLTRFIEEK